MLPVVASTRETALSVGVVRFQVESARTPAPSTVGVPITGPPEMGVCQMILPVLGATRRTEPAAGLPAMVVELLARNILPWPSHTPAARQAPVPEPPGSPICRCHGGPAARCAARKA